jgi:hypothetical protein
MIFAIELKKLIPYRRANSSVRETTTKNNNAVNFIRVTSAYLGDRKIIFIKSVTLNKLSSGTPELSKNLGVLNLLVTPKIIIFR